MQKMAINILTLKLVHIKYIYIYIYKMFEKTYTPNRSEEVLLIEKILDIETKYFAKFDYNMFTCKT